VFDVESQGEREGMIKSSDLEGAQEKVLSSLLCRWAQLLGETSRWENSKKIAGGSRYL